MARDDLNTRPTDIRDAVSREYPEAVKEPCNDCPWRRESLPGWLGPQTADEWCEAAHGEVAIACHQTIPEGGGWGDKTRQCKGAAIFRANICKSPHNPTIETGPADRERVFSWDDEFKAHHEGPDVPPEYKEK